MNLFVDSANLEEIAKVNELGVICGVTTNPSLIAKEGKDFKETLAKIAELVNGPISAEPTGLTATEMIEEGRELAKIHENIIIKLPITQEGLIACKQLSSEGIKINVTLIFSANQALLATRAGASYVSPFVGRLDDINQDGIALVEDICDIFTIHQIETQVIAASIRNPLHITRCALAGAHIATVPYKIFMEMFNHPLTDKGIENFKKDWDSVYKK
ncbi:fructose-6-phosphate aldolase [Erysipelotrichaceae bacterium OttesenSCG-928-M19]|nr:fructose-6-phosphate aldolase [Erysipelotrichaceae bacterium OttesenSCG-928-M19]